MSPSNVKLFSLFFQCTGESNEWNGGKSQTMKDGKVWGSPKKKRKKKKKATRTSSKILSIKKTKIALRD
ncbi:hypothetical protein RUM44_004425 [Polyplax serrata]|uniref:Uncharacterized protein n=1 Tax=Polyplax serrata TaxID=468196 RepID=A0ABR1B2T4_POLSC